MEFRFGPFVYDAGSRSLTCPQGTIRLTHAEAALTEYLATRPDVVVSRDDLFREVLGYRESRSSRALDFHISQIRRKMGDTGRRTRWLHTVRGRGYMLSAGGDAGVAGATA